MTAATIEKEREEFTQWFAGAVQDAAYKAEGLAAYAFREGGGHLPPLVTGKRAGNEAFGPDRIRNVSITGEAQQIDVSTLSGAKRYVAGQTKWMMDIEAEYDERFMKLFNCGSEVDIDIDALMAKRNGGAAGNFGTHKWLITRLDMEIPTAGPPIVKMTLYKVN